MCTVEPPPELCIVGQSKLIQARICRRHERTLTKEDYASMIGGELPFLEHELNQQLMNKLKVMCVCVGHCADCMSRRFSVSGIHGCTAASEVAMLHAHPAPPYAMAGRVRRREHQPSRVLLAHGVYRWPHLT